MSETNVSTLTPRPESVRECRRCGRSAEVSVTVGFMVEGVPDRTTFYCHTDVPRDLSDVLDVLRTGMPEVVAVVRGVA